MEYAEFVVIDTAITFDCNANTPPCIDIRGWIFDDNSGYHGATGVASGAIRFAYDPLWSCVPVGTIIVIYNNSDPNTSMPAVDVSLSDGNCVIVAPVVSNYFDRNPGTPGALACSYPATGWVANGDWTTTALANSGDCARVVDLSGCEVFSLCYASANSNTLIYFNSGGSGSDNVWYFNNGDPYSQANWSEGCADPTTCGANNQTPGAPNNAANAAYIGQFNNNCMPITPLTTSAAVFNAACGCDATVSVSTSGSIGPYTYSWFDQSFASINQSTATVNNLCPGIYHIIVESSIHCIDTLQVNVVSPVTINPQLNVTPVSCSGLSDGSATVNPSGGIAPYTISWSPAPGSGQGTGSAGGLAAGGYSVSITDAAGCQINELFQVASPAALLLPALIETPISCAGSCNAELSANPSGGTGAYTFAWSDGSVASSASQLCAGNYSVTVSDANGCTATTSTAITDPPAIVLDLIHTNAVCGQNNGSATANVSGGTVSGAYSYIWFDAAFNLLPPTATQNNLSPGDYTVVVGDDNGCSTSGTVSVLQPGSPLLSENHSNILCFGDGNGSIDLSINGIPPYTISWTGPGGFASSSEDIGSLQAGLYSVSVIDSGACPASISISITEPLPIQALIASSDQNCQGINDGSITASASGGIAPYLFSLDGINFNANGNYTGLTAGNYMLTISDDFGCSMDTSITIGAPAAFSAVITTSDAGCFAECNGTAQVSISGTGPFSIAWNNGQPASDTLVANLCAGNVTVSISNSSNCVIALSDSIYAFPEISFSSVDLQQNICFGDCLGGIQSVASHAITYSIDAGLTVQPNGDFSGLCAGTYTLMAFDSNACFIDTLVIITEPSALDVSAGSDQLLCAGQSVSFNAAATGGNAPYTFNWGNGNNNASLTFTSTADTSVCVTASDSNGCFSMQSCANLILYPALLLTVSNDTLVCEGSSVNLTASLSGGSGAPYTTQWTNNGNLLSSGQTLVFAPVQNESVVFTASDACTSISDTVSLNVITIPVPVIAADVTSGCAPLTVHFNESSGIAGGDCEWTFGSVGANDDCSATSFTFTQPGCYDISYSLINTNGCISTVTQSQMICVADDPLAEFFVSSNSVSSYNNTVEMNNTSLGADTYSWTLNGEFFSQQTHPSVDLPAELETVYEICLTVTNSSACSDSTCRTVEVIPDLAVYVPNAFTPNSDAANNSFGPLVSGNTDEYHFMIFDRWGTLLFESFTPGELWDGTYKGIPSQIDTYVWTLMLFVENPGKEYLYRGHVTLFR